VLGAVVREYVPPDSVEEQWDLEGLERRLESDFFLKVPLRSLVERDESLDAGKIGERVIAQAAAEYEAKFEPIAKDVLHQYERAVMLQAIDSHWREHLSALDYLRQGIHLRGYAQKQPKQEYKREAFELFGSMLDSIKREVTQHLMAVQIRSQEQVEEAERKAEEAAQAVKNVQYHHADYEQALAQAPAPEEESGVGAGAPAEPAQQPFVRAGQKVGRNDPCPCGSGKKYKNCHGKLS
jgi:preprotein translocase subunit SecA